MHPLCQPELATLCFWGVSRGLLPFISPRSSSSGQGSRASVSGTVCATHDLGHAGKRSGFGVTCVHSRLAKAANIKKNTWKSSVELQQLSGKMSRGCAEHQSTRPTLVALKPWTRRVDSLCIYTQIYLQQWPLTHLLHHPPGPQLEAVQPVLIAHRPQLGAVVGEGQPGKCRGVDLFLKFIIIKRRNVDHVLINYYQVQGRGFF